MTISEAIGASRPSSAPAPLQLPAAAALTVTRQVAWLVAWHTFRRPIG